MSDKRTQILRAALEVFAEHTVAAAPVPVIARAAGVAAGTLYRYWPSKEALANAVYQDAKRLFTSYLARGAFLPQSAGEVFEAYEVMWTNLVAFADQHPQALAFLEHQQHASYLDATSLVASREAEAPAVDLIRSGQRLGVLRQADPHLLITMVFGAFVGLTKADRVGNGLSRAARQQASDAIWSMLTPHATVHQRKEAP
ncbi:MULTISPECIES: TetR/AcrR family transcriptional regulator [unclassified Streptomyces]|uniref:TetR/AcrR family transcriptional regulator n=1 Tax=unclassified Streptomyces TaxID=2593676 RepID=UPI0035DBF437